MSTGSNLAKWVPYDDEAATIEQEDLERTSANFLKLNVGRNVIRILPPLAGKGYGPKKTSPFRVVWTHYISVPGKKDSVSFACPNREANLPCPSCQKAEKLKGSGNKADLDLAYEFFPKRRVYVNCIDREDPEKGVQVMAVGKMIHEALVKIRKDADAGGDFTDPMNGFDIIIERKGTGKTDTEYTTMGARKQSPLGNLDWIEQQSDLNVFGKVLTVAQIRAKFTDDGETKEKPEEKVVNSTATTAPSKAAAPPKERTAADDLEDADVPF